MIPSKGQTTVSSCLEKHIRPKNSPRALLGHRGKVASSGDVKPGATVETPMSANVAIHARDRGPCR